jgi:hypothetical protein
MTTQNPEGRFQVFSLDQYPDGLPAGRYDQLRDAIKHAESVTYKMAVVDAKAESRGFIYCNWESAPQVSPWGVVQHTKRLADGIWSVSTSSHGGIWLSQDRLSQLNERLGHEYPTFCRSSEWFEEDCDWCVPALAFAGDIDDQAMAEAAEKQLSYMARNNMGHGNDGKYTRAWEALRTVNV